MTSEMPTIINCYRNTQQQTTRILMKTTTTTKKKKKKKKKKKHVHKNILKFGKHIPIFRISMLWQ